MQHRDEIIIKKVISEINIGLEMLGETYTTVKEDFVPLKGMLKSIV